MARAPVVQDLALEQAALADALKSGAQGGANNGAITGDVDAYLAANPGSRQMLQEQIYSRAYGTGNPTFATPTASTEVAPPTLTTTPTTPSASTTTASTDGMSTEDMLSLIQGYANGGTSTTDLYNTTYEQQLAQQQSMIDAINARYAGLIQGARDTGVAQQARARAIANTSGSLYSPRTNAAYAGVDADTQKAIDALNAQQGAEIGNAMGQVSDRALQLAQMESEAARANQSSYVNNLLQLYGLMQDDKQSAAQTALAEAGLTGQYGGAPTLAFRQFEQGAENDAFSRYMDKQGLALQRDQMNQGQFTQLDDGTYGYFDPASGQFVALGQAAAPRSSGGSGGGSGSGISDAALLAYYQATGEYPADENDAATITRIYNQANSGLNYTPENQNYPFTATQSDAGVPSWLTE